MIQTIDDLPSAQVRTLRRRHSLSHLSNSTSFHDGKILIFHTIRSCLLHKSRFVTISAFSVFSQFFCSHSQIIHLVPSAASVGQPSVKRGPSFPIIPLGRKPHFSRTLCDAAFPASVSASSDLTSGWSQHIVQGFPFFNPYLGFIVRLNHFFRSFAIMYSVTPGRYRFGIFPTC